MTKRYAFTLTGISPLLMSWDNLVFSDMVREWWQDPENVGKPGTEKGSDRHPSFTWIGRLYHDGENVSMPTANLLTCLRDAGKTVPVPGGKGKTYKEATQTALMFESEHLEFKGGTKDAKTIPLAPILKLVEVANDMKAHCTAVEKMGFKIDIRRAALKTGSKNIRCRPRFDHWQVSGAFVITDPDAMSIDKVKQVFEIAGLRKGLCDWRPGGKTPGPMGRFNVNIKGA